MLSAPPQLAPRPPIGIETPSSDGAEPLAHPRVLCCLDLCELASTAFSDAVHFGSISHSKPSVRCWFRCACRLAFRQFELAAVSLQAQRLPSLLLSAVIQKQDLLCAHRLAGSVSWSTHIVVRAAGGGCTLFSESLPAHFCFRPLFL